MFITPNGSEKYQQKTKELFGEGVKFGEIIEGDGFQCAIGGKTFGIKDQLQNKGFKFHGATKTWYLPGGYAAISAALGIEWTPVDAK